MQTQTKYQVRWLIRRDMPEVMTIERQCYGVNGWTEEELIEHLRDRRTIGMVVEADEMIVGYVVYELHLKQIEIVNLAVLPDSQRQGVGKAIVDRIKQKMDHMPKRDKIALHVNEANLDAQLFLRSQGFLCVGASGVDASYHFVLLVDKSEEVSV